MNQLDVCLIFVHLNIASEVTYYGKKFEFDKEHNNFIVQF